MPGGEQSSKLLAIIGSDGLERLARSSVAVIGVGGVGSNCVEALARGGVGRITIIDSDVVSKSNINRQAIAFHSTVGRVKVDVMGEMIRDIDPGIEVRRIRSFLMPENVADILDEIFSDGLDWIVDAIDTITTKVSIARWAQDRSVDLVSSMGGGGKTDPAMFSFADIYETSGCPMCRAVRKACRKQGVDSLEVLYSPEQRAGGTHGADGDRRGFGTMSYIPPIMGQMLAGFVIRAILADRDG